MPCNGPCRHGEKHLQAGLDFVVCQGSEGGGHAGEVTSMVLWPQMVDELAPLPIAGLMSDRPFDESPRRLHEPRY